MIEVVFSDSEKGSIKIAKSYSRRRASKRQIEEYFPKEMLDGQGSEVIGASFNLDIGDISKDVFSEKRKNIFFEMRRSPYTYDKEEEKRLKEFWSESISDLQKLVDSARNGEDIRIWYSDAPYSICGFYYVNPLLNNYNCKVTAIKLPEYETKEDVITYYSSWGEIEPEEFYKFIPLEKVVTKLERNYITLEWLELQRHNAPLRAVVNGKLTGVPEDFYDYFIFLNIPNGKFKMARLIGEVLGKHQLGIGDWWIAKRIKNIISKGQIEIIKDSKFDYEKILKKRS